jgi:hypothetical protein
VGERRAEYDAKAAVVWREFSQRLSVASCVADVAKLIAAAPPPDSPGRSYFTNLQFFTMNSSFALPGNADENEAALYVGLLERFLEARIVQREQVERVRAAASGKFPWLFDR